MQQRHGQTSNGVTSRRSPRSGSDRLEFEPDLVRRDLYNLEIENVTDPALQQLFRAKRDEIARQITALEDRDMDLTVCVRVAAALRRDRPASRVRRRGAARDHPSPSSQHPERHGRGVRGSGSCGFDRYRAVYLDFPAHIEVRDDISELMVSFGRLLIPEAAAFRADRVEPLLHHEVGTHVVTYQNGRPGNH